MAQFEGTVKEFTKFIGAYARIKVMLISAKHKKEMGKCEECGTASSLHAAHIKGKERPVLIANILSEFIEDDTIRIDLNEFEQKFIEAHLPIESTIRILCNDCHRIYDRVVKEKIVAKPLSVNNAKQDESDLIEKMIRDQMNKSKAIGLAKSAGLTSLANSNTIFSNVSAAQDVWWLEPHNSKFQTDLYIILNKDILKTLYIFRLPANTIRNPESYFIQRNDKFRTNCSDIYITVSGIKFEDKKGFDFSRFLVEEVKY